MCRTNTPSQQGGNSYNHDSSCFGHRVELNTEAREEGGELHCLCCYNKIGILHVLPWQLLLWPQGGAEHWGALCCHVKLGIPIYVAVTVVAMVTGWSWTLRHSVLSWQDGNTYVCCHDSCCYGHRVELNTEAREKDGELYCLRCHDKMGIPICGACRRPIDERVVHALGKTWHVEVSWSVHLSVCSTLVSVCLDCVCVCVCVTWCNFPWCGLLAFTYSLQFWGSLGTWASFSRTGKFWRKLSFLAKVFESSRISFLS